MNSISRTFVKRITITYLVGAEIKVDTYLKCYIQMDKKFLTVETYEEDDKKVPIRVYHKYNIDNICDFEYDIEHNFAGCACC